MKAYFVIDVESVGLHGEAFAVAGGVYLENGAAQKEFCYSCPLEEAKGLESDRVWVKGNVPLIPVTHRTTAGVRSAFWGEWQEAVAAYPEIVMAAECGWPVEARFLSACVGDDPELRMWKGPYPLHEIASFMAAAGMNPMAKYDRTPSEMPEHYPLGDARQSARLLSEALAKLGKVE